jgi:hypothetical protein
MSQTFKRSIPAAATLAIAMLFGAQAQAQTPLPPNAQVPGKGDQMAPPAPGGTSTMPSTARDVGTPQSNNVTNGATTPVTKAKRMTMEERNESRMKREATATNNGATSPMANNVTNGATPADPQTMGKSMASKTRAERKAERDAKRMGSADANTSGMSNSGMGNSQMAKP